MRKVILNLTTSQKRGAVLEDNKVVEWLFEQEDEHSRTSNVFIGRVEDIVPGMEAAFVNIGADKNGFLYRNELIAYDTLKDDKEPDVKQPTIASMLKEGQSIIVQVTKEAVGAKGVRLTEKISLPGKYIVYLPYGNYVAVSKKMNEENRKGWREKAREWIEDREGIIIRTNAEDASHEEIYHEFTLLRHQHQQMLQQAEKVNVPNVLLNQSSLISRVQRDYLTNKNSEIVVDHFESYEQLLNSSLEGCNIHLYQEKEDIFSYYDIEKHLEKALHEKVWLKSGGFLIIEKTEALTVIDVNTGKFTGKHNLRDTVVKTNIEAAYAVAQQLRLRNIGGIILIDFIDMKVESDQKSVLKALKEATKNDRTLTNVAGFTNFGLVEMTRKKARKPLHDIMMESCSVCKGTGQVLSLKSKIAHLEREVFALRYIDQDAILVEVDSAVYESLLQNNNDLLTSMEQVVNKTIYLVNGENGHLPTIRLIGDYDEIKASWEKRMKEV
ncbi:Rne/Rng family ribonuclease [Evansella cellulosilytica]|uniref:Ribonuclease, Rne/Rng family n=1 Tax=Evansella cellulosilytica (strain ATCC 21833 / DSM 2522 / FERM P-1141 / JCM 9156 / N-4) TaxID=649639 RepID=E6TYU3_EVAC2|nr:Rne/Rng family ribonuclease [Evansella cellulosilytica]ADU31278.1 ribonuclease, Rne/Rng family [Evansella cellulosilytica DSM 2522]